MQLTPRYDPPPILAIETPDEPSAIAVVRQRRRLLDLLGSLTDEQWAAPSRCDGWAVCDVAAHLVTVDGFWQLSIEQGVAGTPTRFLTSFDPAATPPLLVAPMRELPPEEILARLAAATDGFLATIEALPPEAWEVVAEAPPGHLPVRLVTDHALWDCWVHERDIALPLGLDPAQEPDEIARCARYAAALGPGLAISRGQAPVGTFAVRSTLPGGSIDEFVLDIDDVDVCVSNGPPAAGTDMPVLTGAGADLIEALSIRAPLPADAPAAWHTLVQGLADAFDLSV